MIKILIKRGTATQWSASTTPLASGELGLDTTNNILKAGNGTDLWANLNPIVLTSSQVDELARDAIGSALVGGSGISVNVNDAADSITVSVDNTIATKSYTDTAVSNIVNSAPATLDTLNELATALGNDANFATTVTTSLADKVSKSGGDTITASTAATIPLTIKAAPSQSGFLLSWQNSSGTNLGRIDQSGNIRFSANTLSQLNAGNGSGLFIPSSATVVPLVVKGVTSQTADLQQWQDSSGTVLAQVRASGGQIVSGPLMTGVQLAATTFNATTIGLIVRGAGSQSADLQQWQDSTGTVQAKIDSTGYGLAVKRFGVSSGLTVPATAMSYFETAAVGNQGIVVRGVASQTANLQEWQNSSGTVIANITPSGGLYVNSNLTQNASGRTFIGGANDYSAFLNVSIPTASRQGIVIRANASQTADLQEWQNSSGTILAEVRTNGDIFTATKIGTTSSTPNIFGIVYGAGTSSNSYAEGSFSTNAGIASPVVFPNEEGWYPYFSYRVPDIVETSDDGASWTNRAPMNYAGLFAYQTSYTSTTSNRYLRITMNQPTFTFLGLVVARFYHGTNNRLYTMKTELLDSSGAVIATFGPTAGTNAYDGAILAQKFNSYNGSTVATRITIENTQFVSGDNFILASLMTYLAKPGTGKSFQSKFPMSWNLYKTTTFQPTQPGSQALIVKGKNQSVSISNAIGDGTTVTFTTTTNNEFVAGNTVNISGINPSSYNLGVVTIASVPTGNTFTVTNSATGTYVSGGNASIGMGANLQEWQNSAGSVVTRISSDARIFSTQTITAGNASDAPAALNAFPQSASLLGLIVKGLASQTGDLQQWQNSAGTTLGMFNAYGTFTANNRIYAGWAAFGSGYGTSAAAGNVVLIAKGVSGQTANLTEWQDSTGTALVSIQSDGSFKFSDSVNGPGTFYWGAANIGGFGGGAGLGNTWNFVPYNSARVAVIVQGASSQTADLQQWRNSSGTVLAEVDKDGLFSNTYGAQLSTANVAGVAGVSLSVGGQSGALANTVLKNSSGATYDFLQFQDSTGSVLAKVTSTGMLDITPSSGSTISFRNSSGGLTFWGGNSSYYMNTGLYMTGGSWADGRLGVDTQGAANKGLVVRGTASQTANLQEWQDSAGTVYAFINPYGQLSIGQSPTIYSNARISLNTVATSVVGMVIRGVASQTADLQQWQDSTGTSLAKVDYAGNIIANSIKAPVVYDINLQTGTTYSFALSDAKSVVLLSNTGNITASIPTNSTAFPVGSSITVIQTNTGQVTIQALTSATTTVYSNASVAASPRLRGLGSSATLIKISTESWYVLGDVY